MSDAKKVIEILNEKLKESGKELIKPDEKLWLVCLRHHGCTFTRQSLADLAIVSSQISDQGWKLMLVHMGDDEDFCQLSYDYLQNDDWVSIADKEKRVYSALGIDRGGLLKVLGPKEWLEGIKGISKGLGIGALQGDGFQLSGMALIENQKIQSLYKSQRASDQLPFKEFLNSMAFSS